MKRSNDESTIGGMPEARLEWHLDNWRRFMRSDVWVDGLPGRSAVITGGGNSATFDELVDSADRRCAMAVDALMLGLAAFEGFGLQPFTRSEFAIAADLPINTVCGRTSRYWSAALSRNAGGGGDLRCSELF